MKTLTVELKQHTPLIHFQHSQQGATLRASEVKPKLDRFILTKLGNGNYQKGIDAAKNNGWLVGKGEHPALDYKMRIRTDESKRINLSLREKKTIQNKFTTEDFPLLLSNMGGRDSKEELVNFSMYEYIYWDILTTNGNIDLYNKLKDYIPYFVANTNFGQRSSKGFGSFTAESIIENDNIEDKIEIDIFDEDADYIKGNTYFLDFSINGKDIYSINGQKILFKIIESFWSNLRKAIKDDYKIKCRNIESTESFIKAMKFVNPDDNDVQRIPAPIMFKPVSYYDDDNNVRFSVYIMMDNNVIPKLKEQYSGNTLLSTGNTLDATRINSMKYVIKYIKEKLEHHKYKNWKVKVAKDTFINVKFYIQ